MTPRARKILAGLLLGSAVLNGSIMYALLALTEPAGSTVAMGSVLLLLPAVIAAVWMLRWPGPLAVGVVAGVAVVAAMEAGAFGALGFLGAWNPGDAEKVMAGILLLVLPNFAVAVIAVVLAWRAFGRSALGHIAIGTGIALVMDAAAGIAAYVATALIGIGSAVQYGSQNTQLEQAVTHVQACAIRYAEQDAARGYPARIEDMGPSGTACLDKAWLRKASKMNVRYVAEARTASGAVPSFAVYGRTSVINDADIGAAADTSGTLLTSSLTVFNDSLLLPSWPEPALQRVAWLRNCALLGKYSGRSSHLPDRLDELLRIGGPGELASLLDCNRFDGAALPKEPDTFIYEGHRVTYRPERGQDGGVEHFAIEARPVTYGVTGINSYLLRDTGMVHITHSDRAVTTSDPVVPLCRHTDSVNTSRQRCANLSRPRLNLTVTLLHPSEVGRDERFTVYVRDARDTSLAPDSTLWIGFYCQADSAHVAHLSAPPVSRRLEHVCSLPHWDPGKPFPVLLYVRDTLGAVGWRIDSIAVRRTP
jgi:hypothetical protein